jgi:PAS domain S-box-containing protein
MTAKKANEDSNIKGTFWTKSEGRCRELLQTAPVAIYEIDCNELRFLTVNDALCRLSGYSREELLAKSIRDFLTAESLERFKDRIRRGLAGETIAEDGEFQIVTKTGHCLWVVLSVKPVYRDGKLDSALVVGYDVTQRKKAEEETSIFSNLFDLASDIIIVHDLKGRFVYFNEATYRQRGYSKEEMANMTIQKLDAPEYDKFTDNLKELVANGSAVFESLQLSKSGERVPVEVHARVIYSQGRNLILSVVRDISERKHLEQQLEEYTKNLERIVDERTKQLKDAERLAAIGATAGMVGHDIRNPLQAIIGDVYLAKTELVKLPDSEAKKAIRENLKAIEQNLSYVDKIISDLQDYARPLRPVARETNLLAIITPLINRYVPKKIKTLLNIPPTQKAYVDPELLRRILSNLLLNAVQAMPLGGTLSITATKENNTTIITVEDTGVGIPDDVKPNLFKPMFTTKSKGQGFGLAVVKRMTEALGGTVTFESQEGQGTKFLVSLPSEKTPKWQ